MFNYLTRDILKKILGIDSREYSNTLLQFKIVVILSFMLTVLSKYGYFSIFFLLSNQ